MEPKILQLNDYNCSICKLPWTAGEVCLHCRIDPTRRTLRPPTWQHYAIITGIGMISVAVLLYGFWMAAR